MQSLAHRQHIAERVSHADCPECRADTERSFSRNSRTGQASPWRYRHVHEFLAWIRPRLAAIRDGSNGGDSVDARIWHRDFIRALHARISLKAPVSGANGRKFSHGYLERLKMTRFPGSRADEGYLRRFADRGASCLDYR
jgi:hypothetical protein